MELGQGIFPLDSVSVFFFLPSSLFSILDSYGTVRTRWQHYEIETGIMLQEMDDLMRNLGFYAAM
jgi:hypothetical protein